MLAIQQYLQSGKTLADLESEYAISAKRHGRFPNLVLLKYSQIESPMGKRIVQECRGIILDENDNWRVVSRAFDKFFNSGEGHAAQIDWSTAKVQEKLDGSLIVVYPYRGEWLVQTSGSPDASGTVGSESFTFADLFWQTAKECGLKLPDPSMNFCFAFELMTPHNRIVVPHTTSRIVLIGVRDLDSQKEHSVEYFVGNRPFLSLGVPCVRSFPLQSIEDIVKSFENLNPLLQEGYVTVDANFNRRKDKHPGYVAIHHAKDGLSDKSLVEIIRSGETSEVVSYFPEIAEQMEQLRDKYEQLVVRIEKDWNENRSIPTQKEFAIAVKCRSYSGVLFCLRNGKISSVKEGLKEMRIENLMELL